MEDSFGCSSNEIALARRWPLMHADEIKGGLMLGIVAAHRCTSRGTFRYVTSRRTELVSISTLPGGHYTNCVFDPFPFELGWYCYVPVSVTSPVFSPAVPHWVYGILPGAYLDVGRRVRLEATLVQSPFTGHHLVFYAQLLFRLASWK